MGSDWICCPRGLCYRSRSVWWRSARRARFRSRHCMSHAHQRLCVGQSVSMVDGYTGGGLRTSATRLASASSAASSEYGEGSPLPQNCGHACHTLPRDWAAVGGTSQSSSAGSWMRLHRASVLVAGGDRSVRPFYWAGLYLACIPPSCHGVLPGSLSAVVSLGIPAFCDCDVASGARVQFVQFVSS